MPLFFRVLKLKDLLSPFRLFRSFSILSQLFERFNLPPTLSFGLAEIPQPPQLTNG